MPSGDAPDPLIDALLLNPAILGADVAQARLVETHISWVLLTGHRAYKIKKPVRLPFLDFTTLAARRHFCEEELRLNRRLAPELYLRVVPIGGTREKPRLGEEPTVEYAVEMREFPSDSRLDRAIARAEVGPADVLRFAETIGRFHAVLPATQPDSRYGTAAAVLGSIGKNLDETAAAMPDAIDASDPLRTYLTRPDDRLRAALEKRRRDGWTRECHGDLHLENLAFWNGRIIAFDALEFDPALRWIDVIDEAAFATMDLIAHERPDLAFGFVNRYLEITGDYQGLELLRLYSVHRALVRAKVRALKSSQHADARSADAGDAYLDVARALIAPRSNRLLITHGLSGSGKTTVTQHLVEQLPAIRVRSDIERKRGFGLDERARSGSAVGRGLYGEEATEATYAALADHAEIGLRAGFDMIVDAAFLQQARRQQFAAVAAAAGARFVVLDLRAPDHVLRQRLAQRQRQARDASEATIEVLEHQLAHREELTTAEIERTVTIDTEAALPIERLVARIRAA